MTVDVEQDEQIKIRLHRHKKWVLGNRNRLSIKSDHVESTDSIERRNIFTFLGSMLVCLIPTGILIGITAHLISNIQYNI
jgi:hypothetical protein